MDKIFPRAVRKWIYGVAIAAVPLAVALGWADPQVLALALPLVLAILNLTPEDVDSGDGFNS